MLLLSSSIITLSGKRNDMNNQVANFLQDLTDLYIVGQPACGKVRIIPNTIEP